jgi:CMP-N-acetylneuraminic acid synthetase
MSGVVGLITARGGSKSIHRKNIQPLAGKPLIAWTIQAALGSSRLSQVIVSTDDEEITQVARLWGARVPFKRPSELSQDDSDHVSVVEHGMRWVQEHESASPQYMMLLQPTSPLRTSEDIDAAILMAEEHSASAVVSVSEMKQHPYLSRKVLDNGLLEDLVMADVGYLRRQKLPEAYSENGAIYLTSCEALLRERTFMPKGTYAYIMPPSRSIDIDSPWDLRLAELIMRDNARQVGV